MSGARKNGRGMRPAEGNRRSPQKVIEVPTDVIGKMVVVSDGPVVKENARVVPLSVEAEEFFLRAVPSRRVPTGEGLDSGGNCIPPREMHEGVFGLSDAVVSTTTMPGSASPADFAGADVPAVAGKKFSAVTEVYSSADDDEGAPLVIRSSKQWHAVVGVGPVRPGEECRSPVDLVIEHSVVWMPNEVGCSYVDSVAVPEPMEHSGVRGTADSPCTGQLMKHSDTSGDWENGRQNQTGDGNTPRDIRMEDQQISPDDGEAIDVGAIGSAAPWFLTGWAAEVEIEFMIDMGCQVTILATSVFERMCASDPRMRSRLRLCGRQLVSADSSPLTVKGELEMTVVYGAGSAERRVRNLAGSSRRHCHRVSPFSGRGWSTVAQEPSPSV